VLALTGVPETVAPELHFNRVCLGIILSLSMAIWL
jgi:hypothetical protein